jgi:hypothetical protein
VPECERVYGGKAEAMRDPREELLNQVPQADAVEQRQSVTDPEAATPGDVSLEADSADVTEQGPTAIPGETVAQSATDSADAADVVEQTLTVPLDDDEYRL